MTLEEAIIAKNELSELLIKQIKVFETGTKLRIDKIRFFRSGDEGGNEDVPYIKVEIHV